MLFERDIIVFLQSLSSPILDAIFKITAYCFDWPMVVIVSLVFLCSKRYKHALRFLILETSGLIVQLILKSIINRPRPYITYPEILNILPANNSSFPSGHAITCMMAVLFLFVLIKNSDFKRLSKITLNIILGFALVLCGLNRMYLGQHYLTDVLGGYLIALVLGIVILKFTGKKYRLSAKI